MDGCVRIVGWGRKKIVIRLDSFSEYRDICRVDDDAVPGKRASLNILYLLYNNE